MAGACTEDTGGCENRLENQKETETEEKEEYYEEKTGSPADVSGDGGRYAVRLWVIIKEQQHRICSLWR